ncbi:MAG: response regulator [Planctomycetota bacterium]|nr:MAG: response regulator [Planctomycetota bacterium]
MKASKHPTKVLVVDDEEEVRAVLVAMLRRAGHEVHEAGNGKEALTQLEGSDFDCVLTDLVMPEMEGLEFIRSFREKFPETKLIAMSGVAAGPTYLQAAERFGVNATLQKPFRSAELIKLIDSLAGQ